MATEKRQRKKEGRQARLEAERAAARRAGRRRRAVSTVLVVVVVGLLLVLIAALGGDDDGDGDETATDTTPATTAPEDDVAPVECAPADGSAERRLEFPAVPELCIDPTVPYTAVFDTTAGTIRVALDTLATPLTTNNFVNLARYHYYDGTLIHRTDPSIDIIQGGSPTTQDAGDPGPGYTIPDEGTTDRAYTPGDLVMARTPAPDSAGAQFFFVAGPDASALDDDGSYVTFGRVTEGLDVVEAILASHRDEPGNRLGGAPDPPVTVSSVTIEEG